MEMPDGAPSPAARDGMDLRLVPFALWLATARGASSPPSAATTSAAEVSAAPPRLRELQRAMADHLERLGHPGAEPLRWAITAVDPQRGLRIEGVGLAPEASLPFPSP